MDYHAIFLPKKYTKWYLNIITAAKFRNVNEEKLYSHHVIPESFFLKRKRRGSDGWIEGDPNTPDNLVNLTYREHLLCHWLLTKMVVGKAKIKMKVAFSLMVNSSFNIENISKIYARYKFQEFNETKYSFSHISGKNVVCTMYELRTYYDTRLTASDVGTLVHKTQKTAKGWRLSETEEHIAYNTVCDTNLYTFVNLDGRKVTCTQTDLYRLHDTSLSIKSVNAMAKGNKKSHKGWYLDEIKPTRIQKRNAVYTFRHHTGREIVCTPYELWSKHVPELSDKSVSALICGSQKSSKGWSIKGTNYL